MRIDSSGNLLVGTTAQYGQGLSLNANATAYFRKSSDAPLTLRRDTTDGAILNLYKDTSTVGSIGNRFNAMYIHSPDGTNGSGLRLADGFIQPCESNGNDSNGDTDLGQVNCRFKDLYLSGGAYLGGTAAANKLDDYEEGTWTPVLVDTNGNTTSWGGYAQGYYTKVGNTVTAWYAFSSSTTAITSRAYQAIQGLPFTNNLPEGASVCTLSRVFDFTFNDEDFYTRAVGTEIQFSQLGSGNAATTLTPTNNQQRLAGGAVYQVA